MHRDRMASTAARLTAASVQIRLSSRAPQAAQSKEWQRRKVTETDMGSTHPSILQGRDEDITLLSRPPKCTRLNDLQNAGLCTRFTCFCLQTLWVSDETSSLRKPSRSLWGQRPPPGFREHLHVSCHSFPHRHEHCLSPCPTHQLHYKPLRAGSVLLSDFNPLPQSYHLAHQSQTLRNCWVDGQRERGKKRGSKEETDTKNKQYSILFMRNNILLT